MDLYSSLKKNHQRTPNRKKMNRSTYIFKSRNMKGFYDFSARDSYESHEDTKRRGVICVLDGTLTFNCIASLLFVNFQKRLLYARHGGQVQTSCFNYLKSCMKQQKNSHQKVQLDFLKTQSPIIKIGYSEGMCSMSMQFSDKKLKIFINFAIIRLNLPLCQQEKKYCLDRLNNTDDANKHFPLLRTLLHSGYHQVYREIFNCCEVRLETNMAYRKEFNLLFFPLSTVRILRSELECDFIIKFKTKEDNLSIVFHKAELTYDLGESCSPSHISHQRMLKLFISFSLQLKSTDVVSYENCILESIFESDLLHYNEYLYTRLIDIAKLGSVDHFNRVQRTAPCSKGENVRAVLINETTLRRTFILPSHLKKTEKVNERICNSDQSLRKKHFATFGKGNLNFVRELLKESLKEIESTSLLKKFILKKDVLDYRVSNAEVQLVVYPVSRNCLDYTFEQLVAGASQHSPDIMRFEMQRFASFADYNYPDTPSAFEFAKAGWYATGLGKETACFVCNVKFSEWTRVLKPFDVHVQLSAECPFVKGENVEAVSFDQTLHPNVREGTIQNPGREYESLTNGVGQMNLSGTSSSENRCLQPHGFANNHLSSTHNGHFVNDFHHTPSIDRSYPHSEIHNLSENLTDGHQVDGFRHVNGDILPNREISVDNPSRSFNQSDYLVSNSSNSFPSVHANTNSESYIDRPYQDNYAHQNNHHFVPFTADIPQQRIPPSNPENNHEYHLPSPISAFTTPKFPAYQSLNVRISSYQGFPPHVGQSPRVLAQAGMFYRGYSDRCSCFWCGIGLQNWSMEDDPWVEHARWSPRCQFMIDSKGEEFMALVQESYREEDPVFPGVNYEETMIAELQSMGFSTESIQSAIKTLRNSGRNVNIEIVANHILENMLTELVAKTNESHMSKNDIPPDNVKTNNSRTVKNEKSQESANALDENSKSLYEETTALKEQLTCKVCMDNSVSVVFLPCGHIVACSICSTRLSKCPICRKFIREKVKTLMS